MDYKQTKITITEDQQKFIQENKDKLTIKQLGQRLSIPRNKLQNNLRIMGLTRRNGRRESKQAKVIEGMFDLKSFGKYYNF